MDILKNCLLVASLSVLLFIKKGDSVVVLPEDAFSQKPSAIITPEATKRLAELTRTSTDGESAIVDVPVDKYLPEIDKAAITSGLDPVQKEDRGFSVQIGALFERYKTEFSLKNGRMHGLATLQRDGDAILSSDAEYHKQIASKSINKLVAELIDIVQDAIM